MNKETSKLNQEKIQDKIEETFPIIASGSYVRPFDISCICWPLNWTYEGHKPQETIEWEYRSNSRKRPLFLYREKYSQTIIQTTFIMGKSDRRIADISSVYLDQEQLTHNQKHLDTLEFISDYLVIQPRVDEGDMLKKLCKFDRKLSLALTELTSLEKEDATIPKIPVERLFSPVREFLAIPFINEAKCSGRSFPLEKDILEYASRIWDKIVF